MNLILYDMVHPHISTIIHINNSTTDGIVNGTIKRQQLCVMEIRNFWITT